MLTIRLQVNRMIIDDKCQIKAQVVNSFRIKVVHFQTDNRFKRETISENGCR